MVVTQLVERLLPTPEVRGSNPVIGKKLYCMFTVNCIEKTKIKKKRLRLAHLKKSFSRSEVTNTIFLPKFISIFRHILIGSSLLLLLQQEDGKSPKKRDRIP